MEALQLYELKDLEKTDLEQKVISFSKDGKSLSLFKDEKWDFNSDLNKGPIKSTSIYNFKFTLKNGNLSTNKEYEEIMTVFKSFVYISSKKNANSTTKDYFQLFKNLFNFLVENDRKSLSDFSGADLIEYRAYLENSYKGNKMRLVKNLNVVKRLIEDRKFIPLCFDERIDKGFEFVFKIKSVNETNQTKVIKDLDLKNIIKKANEKISNADELIQLKKSWFDFKEKYKMDEANQINEYRKSSNSCNRQWLKTQSKYKTMTHFRQDQRDVQLSALILILAYTGMRISEALAIKTNPIKTKVTKCENVEYEIHYIKSTTFKYSYDPMGECNTNDMRSEWLANGEVKEAVRVVQELYEDERKESNCDYLFCSVKQGAKQISYAYVDEEVKKIIELEDFNFHQFRRTFARIVARSAFGDIDVLKEHFKHKTREITEYYMKGDVDNEFFELIEEEQDKIKSSILWENLLEQAKKDFGDDIINELKRENNE